MRVVTICLAVSCAFPQTARADDAYRNSMAQAQAATSRNDWQGLERALNQAAKLSSDSPAHYANATYALGNLYRDRQNPAQAYTYYKAAYARSPVPELRSLALLQMAQCQFACGQYGPARQVLLMLASSSYPYIKEEARQTGAIVDYWGGNRKQAEQVFASKQAVSVRDFAEKSGIASVAALIWLKLFEEEKRLSGASSKESNDLDFRAAFARSQNSKLDAQSLLAAITGNGANYSAQSKLKQAQLTESARYHSKDQDAMILEALKLSLEQYGPEHKKTRDLFECNVHHMDSFQSTKQMADMMIDACKKAYGDNDLRTIKAEEYLGRLYNEKHQEQYGYEIYERCLAKLNKSGNNSHEAKDVRCGLNGLIGSQYASHSHFAQAESYLKEAAEAAKEHTNYSFRIVIMESYIRTLKALGKTERLAWAETQLKDAESEVPVLQIPGF